MASHTAISGKSRHSFSPVGVSSNTGPGSPGSIEKIRDLLRTFWQEVVDLRSDVELPPGVTATGRMARFFTRQARGLNRDRLNGQALRNMWWLFALPEPSLQTSPRQSYLPKLLRAFADIAGGAADPGRSAANNNTNSAAPDLSPIPA